MTDYTQDVEAQNEELRKELARVEKRNLWLEIRSHNKPVFGYYGEILIIDHAPTDERKYLYDMLNLKDMPHYQNVPGIRMSSVMNRGQMRQALMMYKHYRSFEHYYKNILERTFKLQYIPFMKSVRFDVYAESLEFQYGVPSISFYVEEKDKSLAIRRVKS